MNWRQYVVAVRKFYLDHGFLHASALTFYSIFAIVPILATAFGVAKGFGLESFLHTQLEKSFPGQETTVQLLSKYAQNLLSQSSGGLIAGIGLIVLFYSVYSMLSHIESSMNSIWQISTPRKISVSITYYLSLILIAPLILIIASALKLFVAKQIHFHNILLSWTSNILPLLLIISLLYWLYKYMPNVKVKSSAAIFGAVHAGIAYILGQSLLIQSQLVLNNYSAVYGGFAALPMFLLWVQISWVIVLFGTQLCFIFQNSIHHIRHLNFNLLSTKKQHDLLLKVANSCIAKFNLNEPAPSIEDLARELELPPSYVRQLIARLINANILTLTMSTDSREHGYQPAGNPARLSEDFILDSISNWE